MFKTNEYFEGKVKSVAFENTNGQYTIGVMADGSYEFGTDSNEKMTIINGTLEVLLPDNTDWEIYNTGGVFEVEAGVKFNVKSKGVTAYLCEYY